tara:strand:+ start:21230 stop:22075 length:846 start_codon:yes stop_codon:yes gene_type:complete
MVESRSERLIKQVEQALNEDIGSGDLTSDLINRDHLSKGFIIAREPGTLCGIEWFDEVFKQVDSSIQVRWLLSDGDSFYADERICDMSGHSRSILTAERTALNFLQTLSGIASLTKKYVNAVEGTGVTILDTRKTIPGLRLAQKYAVRCGGASNHRIGLYDAILVKENHINASGSLEKTLNGLKKIIGKKDIKIEVEVENIPQLESALKDGIKNILLDNFSLSELYEAVKINKRRANLEASGNISLKNVREIAETGIDQISIGALTKNLLTIDFSMLFEKN